MPSCLFLLLEWWMVHISECVAMSPEPMHCLLGNVIDLQCRWHRLAQLGISDHASAPPRSQHLSTAIQGGGPDAVGEVGEVGE